MGLRVVVLAVLLSMIVVAVLMVSMRARRGHRTHPTAAEAAPPSTRLAPTELAAVQQPSVDLDTVMADAGATLYIPIDSERRYLAVARPDARVEGRTSP